MGRSKLKQLVEAALQDDGPLGADARITLREMGIQVVRERNPSAKVVCLDEYRR